MSRFRRILPVLGILSVLPVVRADDAPLRSDSTTRADAERGIPSDIERAFDEPADPARANTPLEHDPTFEPTSAERRILVFLDMDGDGSLSPPEFGHFPAPMRLWLQESKVDNNGPVPVGDFAPLLRKMLDDLRDGQHSLAAARRAPGAGPATPTAKPSGGNSANGSGGSPQAATKVDTSGPLGLEASYAFGRMDQKPRDEKLQLEEWAANYKTWFEQNGITIPREMDKETFVQNYVRFRSK
jgi:hypothetical protein